MDPESSAPPARSSPTDQSSPPAGDIIGQALSTDGERPQPVKHVSAPPTAYQSPLRHHHRATSAPREVKETLNARSEYSNSEDDGTAQHRINQYIIKQEIGRGSFGAVHLAVDQYGKEYAVKEFSKARLRKRAQSNLLRRPNPPRRHGHFAASRGFNSPLHRHSPSGSLSETGETNNSLDLIKEEIAIMKKLNHPNVVSLIEVLDDPDEDSLYMVLEMCKKGVIMKVGLNEDADPYEEEQARCWFRDLILGIEYLHHQGIVHRDLKPDNCLITGDDVLKIVDFGVSEMFEKESEMSTDKSVGSPAFMPPELCVAKHGHVSGRALDIWSMGATLYCLRFGRIPFYRVGIFELYEAIRNDELDLGDESGGTFGNLMRRLLEKDPQNRIKMDELREHPWVTKNGTDPLLPQTENIAPMIETTEEDVNAAITGNMSRLLAVMKAAKQFKSLLFKNRSDLMEGIFGRASRIVAPPSSIRSPPFLSRKAHSSENPNHSGSVGEAFASGIHREIGTPGQLSNLSGSSQTAAVDGLGASSKGIMDPPSQLLKPTDAEARSPTALSPSLSPPSPHSTSAANFSPSARSLPRSPPIHSHSPASPSSHRGISRQRGHAHDPLEDQLYLNIGAGPTSPPPPMPSPGSAHQTATSGQATPVVCESPSAVDINVFESAYQEEVRRIQEEKGKRATIYLTRRVDGSDGSAGNIGRSRHKSNSSSERGRLAGLLGGSSRAGARSGFARLAEDIQGAGKG